MTACIPQLRFEFHPNVPVDVAIDAPETSSDGGLLLLRSLDQRLGLTEAFAGALGDARDGAKVRHSRLEQARQRIYQISMGYEDQNDADFLRKDALLQVACDLDPSSGAMLSSQPSLSRFENSVTGRDINHLRDFLEKDYVDRLPEDTKFVLLDLDSTDDPTHGDQQLSMFHGFYDQHMYHPLLAFDGLTGELISVLLRPGNAHAARAARGLLVRLIRRIKRRFPKAAILVRGDSAFAMPRILDRLEDLDRELGDVKYVIGLAKNAVLLRMAAPPSQEIYDGWYCRRGEVENYIKDFKNALNGDRLSCCRFVANAFRLILHATAYRLMHALRAEARALGLDLGRVQLDTLRLKLLKIAAQVTRSVRRILIHLPECFPMADAFRKLAAAFGAKERLTAPS